MFDLIGDIHGHADELEHLLQMLGYRLSAGVYRHPERQAIFLGDFIDRGPQIRRVLQIVRPMVEAGAALAVTGNHEWNALAYHTPDPSVPGEYLRRHTEKNERQHRQTLQQLSTAELQSYLAWFRTLPMWLELDGLRAIHACWDVASLQIIAAAQSTPDKVTPQLVEDASRAESGLFKAVEMVLKGKEMELPKGHAFYDKDGHHRTRARTKWFLPPSGHTYRTYALQAGEIACDEPLAAEVIDAAAPYTPSDRPVFFGHYWLSANQPRAFTGNAACLDFSVAKGGMLCAYRWSGEPQLNDENFMWVNASGLSS